MLVITFCPGGGIGRRVGLKIRLGSPPVPVQVWLRAPLKGLSFEGPFLYCKYIKKKLILSYG